jgi:hypothetical protein
MKNGYTARFLFSIASGLFALTSAMMTLTGIIAWTKDPIKFVTYGNNPILANYVLLCFIGALVGTLPWANIPNIPDFSRRIVTAYGVIIGAIGMVILSREMVELAFDPSMFAVAGWQTCLITLGILCAGFFSIWAANTHTQADPPSA